MMIVMEELRLTWSPSTDPAIPSTLNLAMQVPDSAEGSAKDD